MEPVSLKDLTPSGDWFLHRFHDHYDAQTGLSIPKEMELLEA